MLRASAEHDAETFRSFIGTVKSVLPKPPSTLRVLDLGCGWTAPMTLMLHASGYQVTGADAEVGIRWGLGFRADRYRNYFKKAGLAKTLRKAAGEMAFDRVYYSHLAKVTGLRLTERGLDVRAMDIHRLSLAPESYDVVHSNATWEHLGDVAVANRMVGRALAPGGIAYIEVHLFPSLSGGHDLPWIVPGQTIMGNVKPWQHLRDARWKAPVFLNRLRERDYRRLFDQSEELEVLDWRTEFTEGQELLTPEIRQELKDYSEEELTKRSIIIVARRR